MQSRRNKDERMVIKVNADLLRSVMVLNHDTVRSLADSLGITEQSMYNKLKEDGTEFKQGEIAKIKLRYNLSNDQVDAIFFAELVSNLAT